MAILCLVVICGFEIDPTEAQAQANPGRSAQPSAMEVLELARRAREALPPLTANVEVKQASVPAPGMDIDDEEEFSQSSLEYFRDGDRRHRRGSRVTYRAGGTGQSTRKSDDMLDGELKWHYQDLGRGRPLLALEKISQDAVGHAVAVNRADMGGWVVLNGIFTMDLLPYYEIMMGASDLSMQASMQDVDGHPCYVLESQGEYGRHKVWIDPEFGFQVRRAEASKNENDFIAPGEPLNREPDDRHSASVPIIVRSEFKLRDVVIDKIGNHYVATSGKTETNLVRQGGTESYVTARIDCKNIELEPDFDALGAFRMEVPDHTQVILDWARGVRYEWMHGEAVPLVSDREIARINDLMADLDPAADSEEPDPETREIETADAAVTESGDADSARNWAAIIGIVFGGIAGCGILIFAMGRARP